MTTPDAPSDDKSEPRSAGAFVGFGVAMLCAVAAGWYLTRDGATETDVGPAEIAAEQPTLGAGTDIRVFWRVGHDGPYGASFEVTASAGEHGQGAVTGEQLFTRLRQLELPGKLVQASVRELAPKAPISASTASTPLVEAGAEDYARFVRLDAKGRSVMFLDLETGAPEPPDPSSP